MTEMRPIKGFPDYAITRTGEVYRITPHPASDARKGPTPRRIAVVMCGNGKQAKLHPCVTLCNSARNPGGHKRSIAQLMRDVWPEVVG